MEDNKIYPGNVNARELAFISQLSGYIQQVMMYENPEYQRKAQGIIPVDRLKKEAEDAFKGGDSYRKSERDELIIQLLKWFKTEFFQWVDSPKCPHCNGTTSPRPEPLTPTAMELYFGASRIEGYNCNTCNAVVRFPRYNNPSKLLDTREGRCGEWANCFTLCAISLGFDARLVLDKTDHVWTEIWSPSENRWLHCDSCENSCDKPLVYEEGWGKMLTYAIAISPTEVADVTWRYSRKHREVLSRRLECREKTLIDFIMRTNKSKQGALPASKQNMLTERNVRELAELLWPKSKKDLKEDETEGRISGSLAWRQNRGETGAVGTSLAGVAPAGLQVMTIQASEILAKEFLLTYSASKNQYQRPILNETKSGWKSLAHSTDGIARKEELDWKTVYLARTEGRNTPGKISWKIELSNVFERGMKPHTISVKISSNVFENGNVRMILCAGDTCHIINSEQGELIIDQDLDNCRDVSLTITLDGGKGSCAWQHAQLFRCPLDSTDNGLEIKITFK